MSTIAELLSQCDETSCEVGSHGSGPAAHEDGALFDRVAVPVVERDRGPLPEREPPVRPIDVEEIAAAPGSPGERGVPDRAQAAATLASAGGGAG